MSKKPIFWFVLTFISIGCTLLAFMLFPKMHSFLKVEVTMDRSAALNAGRNFAHQYNMGPRDFRQAISFETDIETRNYIELETGGIKAFQEFLDKDWYSPYAWHVRHFKEKELNELHIRFKPNGELFGFEQKLSDSLFIKNPGRDSALSVAQRSVQKYQQIKFTEYTLVDESVDTCVSGRFDYSFIFQRPGYAIGEAQYQFKLVVSGNRLTEMTPSMKIPDSFEQRYEQKQKSNNIIFYPSIFAAVILYLLGGCIIGLIILIRKRQVLWRTPIILALIIGVLTGLDMLNNGMALWMKYDPSLSAGKFVFSSISRFLFRFVIFAPFLAICFAVAESLTRKAFPNHIRLWRIWSKEAASSKTVLGYTVGALMGVSIYFALYVSLSLYGSRTLGWWLPSEIEPGILASVFPWFSAILTGLVSGLQEECFFRAIPIAGAVLIGQKLGYRRTAIGIALVLQTVIFCGGHANYPQHPAYARLLAEVLITSFALGVIYLKFGLLPAILLHGFINVTWDTLPVLTLTTSGAWQNIFLAAFIALIPLWIVFIARMRTGKWIEIKADNYNQM